MYAIVDIETTGGYATEGCITEIAIVLHNGKEIEGKYETLIKPNHSINWYVQKMTGITNALVASAPSFEDVAEHIYNLLKDRIFIAHNVNFDYSFVIQHLKAAGFVIDVPKICTIKLSRKLFPGLPKYGLGSLARHFNIANAARHRAAGDAMATSKLFEILVLNDKLGEIEKLSKRRKSSQYLPPNLQANIIANMPSLPGVYYFHNNKGKIIYVGKAINLKKRVSSHFSNNKNTKQKQDFLRNIYNITWKDCSSDLTASVFESIEIKRLWPQFNKGQKHYERQYGIFMFEDALGYKRLAIDNKKKILQPIALFHLLTDARQALFAFSNDMDIHPSMFFLSKELPEHLPQKEEYNNKIDTIEKQFAQAKQTFLLHDGALNYLLVEQGKFWGMGKIDSIKKLINSKNAKSVAKLEVIKQYLTPYQDNLIIQSHIKNYVIANPNSIIVL